MSQPATNTLTPSHIADRGLAAHQAGNLIQAETAYRAALKENPGEPTALNGLGVLGLQTGANEAALELFEAAIASAPTALDALSNKGIALNRLGRHGEAADAFAIAIQSNANCAAFHVGYADASWKLGMTDRADKHYRLALTLEPENLSALSNYGTMLTENKKAQAGVKILEKAAEISPGSSAAICNLGAALISAGELDAAVDRLCRLIKLEPHDAAAHFNLGNAYHEMQKYTDAALCYEQAARIDPQFSRAHHNLAHAYFLAGELEKGWPAYEWRWQTKSDFCMPADYTAPIWNGCDLRDKTVGIWGEQGIGDKLLFFSMLRELSELAGAVVLEVEPRLEVLVRRSFPEFTVVVREPNSPAGEQIQNADFQLPLASLGRRFRNSLEDFDGDSYLSANDATVQQFRQRYEQNSTDKLIGLSWRSRPAKSISLLELAPVLSLPGVKFVSLQYGDVAEEVEKASTALGCDIQIDNEIEATSDIDGFAAQVAAMDAVVTIQNTTLYMAGGIGVPTFALASPIPDWRWFGQTDSVWHNSVKLYGAQTDEDRTHLIPALVRDLRLKLKI